MRKVSTVAALLTVLVVACGGVSDEPSVPSTAAAGETSHADGPSSTLPTEETSPIDGSDGRLQTEEEQVLEVEPVDPVKGEDGSSQSPAPPSEDAPAPPPVVDHSNPQVATAITDLVVRFGIDVAAVEVVSIEEVTWPDGSVGCPLPGMRYTQALVNGSRIVLKAGGVQYQYNSGGGREPFYCANPSEPVPGDGDYGDI